MNLTIGPDAPEVINVLVEIQKGGGRNKYEFDKQLGLLKLDRVNQTRLTYPADYGFVPETLCEDGDPLDALIVIEESLHPGVIVPVRPIGVLYMVDEGEKDEKLICVAAKDLSHDHIKEVSDLGPTFIEKVEHFYRHYKDWKNDWQSVKTEFNGWGDAAAAKAEIVKAQQLAKNSNK